MNNERIHFMAELLKILQTNVKQFEKLNEVMPYFTDTKRYALFQNVNGLCSCRISSSLYEDEIREAARKVLSLNEGGISSAEKYDIIMKSPNHNLIVIPLVQGSINPCEGYLVLCESDYKNISKKSGTRYCLIGLTSFLTNMRLWEDTRNNFHQDTLLRIYSESVFQNDLRYILDKKQLNYNICLIEFRGLKRINQEQGFDAGSRTYLNEVTKIKNLVSANDRMYRLYGNKCILLLKGDIHDIYEYVKKEILDSISIDYGAVMYEIKKMAKQLTALNCMDILYKQLLDTMKDTKNREMKIYV